MPKKDPVPTPPGAAKRAQALRRLTDLRIPVDGTCGLHKLTFALLSTPARAGVFFASHSHPVAF
jgi:hypothetical protein